MSQDRDLLCNTNMMEGGLGFMKRRLSMYAQKASLIITAGMLFQAGGCSFDTNSVVAGLTTQIVGTFISDFVFGAFNLV